MSVQLYKDGDAMAIQTDCQTEDEFVEQFSDLLSDLISNNKYEHDWEFQFSYWLPQFTDICCAYRGYKNKVTKRTVMLSGYPRVSDPPTHEIDPSRNRKGTE